MGEARRRGDRSKKEGESCRPLGESEAKLARACDAAKRRDGGARIAFAERAVVISTPSHASSVEESEKSCERRRWGRGG